MFELNKIVRQNILELTPYSSARDEFTGIEGIFLDANENPFGQYNRYPDPYQNALKTKISELKTTNYSKIFIGNGSDEIIDLLFRIFCEPGKDKVLSFSPTYGMYKVSASINNVELIEIPLNDNFEIDLEITKKRFTDQKVKMIFVCSPNNPSGNRFSEKTIEAILNLFHGIVVIDEAYVDFSNSESMIKWIDKYPNLVITQTMSKAWGLAAARIGFAFSNPAIINLLNKIKPPYNISELNQQLALKTLSDSHNFSKNLQSILSEKSKVKQSLESLKIVKKIYPSDANFFLVEFENADSIYQKLIEKGVVVRNRSKLVPNCLRISIGTPKENKILLDELKQIENEKSTFY